SSRWRERRRQHATRLGNASGWQGGGRSPEYSRRAYFGVEAAISFWKRGSLRSGSNIGSSRSNAGVIGGFAARGASYGIESSLVKAEMERSESPILAATRARISSGLGPISASFSIGIMAIARSARVSAAVLSPRA